MSYILQSDIVALIPPEFLLQALDDDGDGVEDPGLWDTVAADASRVVDAYLGGRYATPFAPPVPPLVWEAAKVFALEALYQRRGLHHETNPWYERAAALREQLRRIADHQEPLSAHQSTAATSGGSVSAVTEPSRTTSSAGYLST